MGSSVIPWALLLFHGFFCYSMGSSVIPWALLLFHGLFCYSMGSSVIPWVLLLFHGLFCYSMGSSVIPWVLLFCSILPSKANICTFKNAEMISAASVAKRLRALFLIHLINQGTIRSVTNMDVRVIPTACTCRHAPHIVEIIFYSFIVILPGLPTLSSSMS